MTKNCAVSVLSASGLSGQADAQGLISFPGRRVGINKADRCGRQEKLRKAIQSTSILPRTTPSISWWPTKSQFPPKRAPSPLASADISRPAAAPLPSGVPFQLAPARRARTAVNAIVAPGLQSKPELTERNTTKVLLRVLHLLDWPLRSDQGQLSEGPIIATQKDDDRNQRAIPSEVLQPNTIRSR